MTASGRSASAAGRSVPPPANCEDDADVEDGRDRGDDEYFGPDQIIRGQDRRRPAAGRRSGTLAALSRRSRTARVAPTTSHSLPARATSEQQDAQLHRLLGYGLSPALEDRALAEPSQPDGECPGELPSCRVDPCPLDVAPERRGEDRDCPDDQS